MKHFCFPLAALALAGLLGGCGKSAPTAAAPATPAVPAAPATPAAAPIARFHWLGMKRLAAETNAASFLRIWNEPETARLETQTLDKLSTAPWRLMPRIATTNPAAAPALRPLLDDLVNQESYGEVRRATNQPGELVFAIRLSPERSALWETNLAAVLESLTGLRVTNAPSGGWTLRKHEAPDLIEFTRSGEWTLLGAASGTNHLLADEAARIGLISRNRLAHNVAPDSPGDLWLEADLDLAKLGTAFARGWQMPDGFPQIALAMIGDGQTVLTRGNLTFASALSLPLEPWMIPTNLARGSLGSFTAVRGFAPWLAASKTWQDFQLGPAPNQLFSWASREVPMATFFAVPLTDASNRVSQITQSLILQFGEYISTNNFGRLERATEFNGLGWLTVPFASPFLQSAKGFVLAGFFPNAGSRMAVPPPLLQASTATNLAYYDWELTGPRISTLLQLGQFLRLVLHKTQLPSAAAMNWFMANGSSLGPCITTVFQTAPEQLSLSRRSSIGLTAVELHLLADWLESPDFPRTLNSFQPPTPRRQPSKPPVPVPDGSK